MENENIVKKEVPSLIRPGIYESRESFVEEILILPENGSCLVISDLHGGKFTSKEELENILFQIDSTNPSFLVINGDLFALFENMFGMQNGIDYGMSNYEIKEHLDFMFTNRFFDEVIDQNLWASFFEDIGKRLIDPECKLEKVVINFGNHDLNYLDKGRETVINRIKLLIPKEHRDCFSIGSDLVNLQNSKQRQIAEIVHGNLFGGIQAIHELQRDYFPHLPAPVLFSKIAMFFGDYLIRPIATVAALARQYSNFADVPLRIVLEMLNKLTPLDHLTLVKNSQELIEQGITPVFGHLHDNMNVHDEKGKIIYVAVGKSPESFLVLKENGETRLCKHTLEGVVQIPPISLTEFKKKYNGGLLEQEM